MKKSNIRISFEFFPPKSTEGMTTLMQTAETLAHYSPDFFSVTYGAGGSTREGTINTVKTLQKLTNISVAPHLSCIGSTRQEIIDMLEIYKQLGVKRIVALRGDLPSGMGQSGELMYANQLISLIREASQDQFIIDAAAYPEYHPQAVSAHEDIFSLKKKMDAGANNAITQYFFNPDAYFDFMDQCIKYGIDMPITPGIMPITNFVKLVRFSDCCGAEIPRWIRKRLEGYGQDHVSLKEFGIEIVYALCERLIQGGAPGLHFYTLNHAEESVKLLQRLQPLYLAKNMTATQARTD